MTDSFDIRNSAFGIRPVPPKGSATFAWSRSAGFIHFIRRSLGEGGHLAPHTALRDSAFAQCEASPQVVSKAKDNMAAWCEVGTTNSELRSSCFFNSTFEIHHSEFALSSNQSCEGEIRQKLSEADLVDCMVALPSLFLLN